MSGMDFSAKLMLLLVGGLMVFVSGMFSADPRVRSRGFKMGLFGVTGALLLVLSHLVSGP